MRMPSVLQLIRAPPLPAALAFPIQSCEQTPYSTFQPQGGPTNFLAKRALLETVLSCSGVIGCFLLGEEGRKGPYNSVNW